jgi:hypothetical protein
MVGVFKGFIMGVLEKTFGILKGRIQESGQETKDSLRKELYD